MTFGLKFACCVRIITNLMRFFIRQPLLTGIPGIPLMLIPADNINWLADPFRGSTDETESNTFNEIGSPFCSVTNPDSRFSSKYRDYSVILMKHSC